MAFKYYTGVQEASIHGFVEGGSTASVTNIDELNVGAIRRIWHTDSAPYGNAQIRAQMMVDHGFYVIPTLFDHTIKDIPLGSQANPAVNTFYWHVQNFAQKFEGIVDVCEFVNEIFDAEYLGSGGAANPNGVYWDRLDRAIEVLGNHGIGTILSPCPTGRDVRILDAANTRNLDFSALAGIGLHPYFSTPGTSLSTGMLGWVKSRRDQIDANGAAAAALPLFLTEFGYATQNFVAGDGAAGTVLCPGATTAARETSQDNRLDQCYTNWATHHETLKIRAACWYLWSDTSVYNTRTFNFCGIRTDVHTPASGPSRNPAPWHYKNGGGQSGTVGIKATLDSFGAGEDLGAATPPTVTSLSAQNVASTSATIRGTVNPNSVATTYVFQWGETVAYGNQIPLTPASAGSGATAVAVSRPLTGLVEGQTYHYRVRATSAGGVSASGDQSFTTLASPQPPTVVTGRANSVEQLKATLTGQINGHGLPTRWKFQYGLSTAYGEETVEKDLP